MGNQNEKQSLPQTNHTDQNQQLNNSHSKINIDDNNNQLRQLKTSGAQPNLLNEIGAQKQNHRQKPALSQQNSFPLDGRPPKSFQKPPTFNQNNQSNSMATQSTTPNQTQLIEPQSIRSQSKSKQQIMSAMTSRVLQKEKQLSSATNLHSFVQQNNQSNPSINLPGQNLNHSSHSASGSNINIRNQSNDYLAIGGNQSSTQNYHHGQGQSMMMLNQRGNLALNGQATRFQRTQELNISDVLLNNTSMMQQMENSNGKLPYQQHQQYMNSDQGKKMQFSAYERSNEKLQMISTQKEPFANISYRFQQQPQPNNYISNTSLGLQKQLNFNSQEPSTIQKQSVDFGYQSNFFPTFQKQSSSVSQNQNFQYQSQGRIHSKSAHISTLDQNQPPNYSGYQTHGSNKYQDSSKNYNQSSNSNIHQGFSSVSLNPSQNYFQSNQVLNFNSQNFPEQMNFESNRLPNSASILSQQQTTNTNQNQQTQNNSSNKVIVHQNLNEPLDVYKTQQKLLKQLKLSKRKMSSTQNQQPKQKRTHGSQARQQSQMQNENFNALPNFLQTKQSIKQQSSQKQLGLSFNHDLPPKSQNLTPHSNTKTKIDSSPKQSSFIASQQKQSQLTSNVKLYQNNMTTERLNFNPAYFQDDISNFFQQNVASQTALFSQQDLCLNHNYCYQEPERTFKFGDSGQLIGSDIIMSFISFDNSLFSKLLMLSPSWHTSALQAIDEHCNQIENQFIQTYMDFLFFKQSYTQTFPIKFCGQRGLRLERVIECELLSNKKLQIGNKTFRLGYQYKVHGDKNTYKAEFKFDTCKTGQPRLTWLHQDNNNKETYTQPIQQVSLGDCFEFSMSLISLQGLISEVKWEAPVITETPKLSVLNYDKDWAKKTMFFRKGDSSIKIYCDLNRICELEDAVVEWYEERYYQRRSDLYDLSFLKELFVIKRVDYAGVDGAICKVQMIANQEGCIEKKVLGLEVIVKEAKRELQNEIKRIGYLKDREQPLQLRIGDQFMLYISKSSA